MDREYMHDVGNHNSWSTAKSLGKC